MEPWLGPTSVTPCRVDSTCGHGHIQVDLIGSLSVQALLSSTGRRHSRYRNVTPSRVFLCLDFLSSNILQVELHNTSSSTASTASTASTTTTQTRQDNKDPATLQALSQQFATLFSQLPTTREINSQTRHKRKLASLHASQVHRTQVTQSARFTSLLHNLLALKDSL
jgi:hypothetical protein